MATENKHSVVQETSAAEIPLAELSTVTPKEPNKHSAPKDESTITPNEENQSKTPFSVVEAYKNIRVHLLSSLNSINGKTVVISSPYASDGKSTTAVNIAITISHLNKKVLLIDADSRRSTIHKKLKMENELGCTDVVSGEAKLQDVVKPYNNYLDILTAGSAVSNPSELFSSSDFDLLLQKARDSYDYIIVDSPPINIVSDALVVAQKCDGLVLVARATITTYESFKSAVDAAKSLDINIIGTVLNGIDRSYNKYYKYKYNKYSKKYGKYNYYSRY